MKMIKASHWSVRGELEFNKRVALQGRDYILIDTTVHHGARGQSWELLVWEGRCTICRRKFTFETTRGKFYPTATCPQHRPARMRGSS